jgi:hypothetical protein
MWEDNKDLHASLRHAAVHLVRRLRVAKRKYADFVGIERHKVDEAVRWGKGSACEQSCDFQPGIIKSIPSAT